MLNCAIVGCGKIAGGLEDVLSVKKPCTHAGAYTSHERTKLASVSDIDEIKLARFSQRWNVKNVFTDYVKMFKEIPIDILSVCTQPEQHYFVVRDALKHCNNLKFIWCEKPMGVSVCECYEMLRMCEEKNVSLVVNHTRRWDSLCLLAEQIAQSGELGKIYAADCKSFVGIMNSGTHMFDLAMQYVRSDIVSVCANQLAMDKTEDAGVVGTVDFANDVVGFVDCVWKENNGMLCVNLRGDRGVLEFVSSDMFVVKSSAGEQQYFRDNTADAAMLLALKNMLHNIDNNKITLDSRAVCAVEAAISMYASAHGMKAHIEIPLAKNDFMRNAIYKSRLSSMTKDGNIPIAWGNI